MTMGNGVARWYLRGSVCMLAIVSGFPAFAQEAASTEGQLEEIVVVAQKREENQQKVPLAITTFNSGALESRGIDNITDIAISMPGIQLANSASVVLPYLRGVGSNANAVGSESSVAVYLDGVYYSRLRTGFLDLNNIDRIEVLKGPQGTLFGRNSSGGVIHLITKDPSHTDSVRGSIGYGRFDAFAANIYATTGLTDRLAADIAISGKTDGGYGRNVTTGKKNGYEDSILVRSKLLFEPSDTTRFLLSGLYSWSNVSAQGGTYPGTTQGTLEPPYTLFRQSDIGYYNVRDNEGMHYESETFSLTLKAEQELSFARLVSISAYIREDEVGVADGIYDPAPNFRVDLPSTVKQFTQELQLQGQGSQRLNWILGLYYYNNVSQYDKGTFFRGLPFGPGLNAPAEQRSVSYAAFGQATYEVAPGLKLTGGLRYTIDKIKADSVITLLTNPPIVAVDFPEDSKTFKKLTFKTAIDYQVQDNVLAYASFSRGYKSGQYNLLTYTPVPTDPEVLDAYEIGIKSELFDRRLRINASAFYYDITDPQVLLIANGTILLSNAQGARIKGVELEGQVAVTKGLTARFGATYLDPKYTDYQNAPSGPPNPNTNPALGPVGGTISPLLSIDAKGNQTPYASKFTANLGFDYILQTSHGDWQLTADYYYNDGFYFEPDNFLRQGRYSIVNAQLKYMPTKNLGVRIWGKNLTGQKYAASASTQEGVAGYPWMPAPPRKYGIAVDFSF
jgi:iron complex outermembrane recepter protein